MLELFLIRTGRKKEYAERVCMIFRRHVTIARPFRIIAFGATFFGKISLAHFPLENVVITFLTLGYCKFLTPSTDTGNIILYIYRLLKITYI